MAKSCMSHSQSRRGFLTLVSLGAFALGLGDAALAQEKAQPSKRANKARLKKHPFELMICDYVQFKLARVDERGRILWEHRPEGKVWDFVLTDDNQLIYPIITDKQEVRCLDFEKNLSIALGGEQMAVHLNLLAFAILFSPISKITGIFGNMLSRKNEYQADAYASTTFSGLALQKALKKLSVENLSNLYPHPTYVFFHYSHPPLLKRLKAVSKLQ